MSAEDLASKLGAARAVPGKGNANGPLEARALAREVAEVQAEPLRLCARGGCSHLHGEHKRVLRPGRTYEDDDRSFCFCCDCPQFVDEPDFVSPGPSSGRTA